MTRRRCPTLTLTGAAWLAAAACACSSAAETDDTDPGVNGGQTGSETYGCLPESEVALEPDTVSPIGVSPNQTLAAFSSHERGELRWARSGETQGYTLVIVQSGPARFEERVWRSDDSGIELAASCDDALVVPVAVELDTDDGAFAERWETQLTRSASGFASLSVNVDFDTLAGSYELTEAEAGGAERVRLLFDLNLLGSTLGGSIAAQITETLGSDSDPERPVSGREVPIATFLISSE